MPSAPLGALTSWGSSWVCRTGAAVRRRPLEHGGAAVPSPALQRALHPARAMPLFCILGEPGAVRDAPLSRRAAAGL
ncbi:hypothetical protein ACHMW6_00060 (plasmid) [Pseudoduganella sp. UC29_106]|uniref:hypothetical protein n=1 Tax=Pseudoduganella sp. UC29_106 TaxID=3374553 RepID=UPI003756FC07